MNSLRNDNFKTIYIVRESPSEEPIGVFRDLRDAYRFSSTRYMNSPGRAHMTNKYFYVIEEELQNNLRVTIWHDAETGTVHSVSKYDIMDL